MSHPLRPERSGNGPFVHSNSIYTHISVLSRAGDTITGAGDLYIGRINGYSYFKTEGA